MVEEKIASEQIETMKLGGPKIKVLWVEDEPVTRELCEMLARHHCWGEIMEIKWLEDGYCAWQVIKSGRPNIFITDDSHPGLWGTELLRMMNKQKIKIPALFFSGNAWLSDAAKVMEWRATLPYLHVDYLQKPFFPSDLQTKVEGLYQVAIKTLSVRQVA